MSGIGKDKETEKEMDKVEKDWEEDKLPLDSEAGDKRPFDDDDDDFAEEDFAEEDEADRRTASSRSIILLVLLLLLALGGGYYYLNSTPAPEQPLASAPVKVKVQPEAAVSTVAPETEAVAAPTVPVAPADVVVIPVGGSKVAASVPATSRPFALAAGAFLSPKHQHDVEKKIRRLGYTPKVETTYSLVPMTRLLLGVYEPVAAAARKNELTAQIPELFSLKQGDKVALYAGSFQSLNAARSYADQLYLRGIHVDEETVSLRMPLKKVSYGSFATRVAAEKAAKKAAAAGLTAQVIKR